jgi:hypothetical protein
VRPAPSFQNLGIWALHCYSSCKHAFCMIALHDVLSLTGVCTLALTCLLAWTLEATYSTSRRCIHGMVSMNNTKQGNDQQSVIATISLRWRKRRDAGITNLRAQEASTTE